LLARVAEAEERSKSCYIKKGFELILQQRLEDMEDYEAATQAHAAHAAHVESGEPMLSLDDVFGRE
jgi:predicted DNA-binding protein